MGETATGKCVLVKDDGRAECSRGWRKTLSVMVLYKYTVLAPTRDRIRATAWRPRAPGGGPLKAASDRHRPGNVTLVQRDNDEVKVRFE